MSLIPDTGLIDFTEATETDYSQSNSDNEALKAGRASKASKATRVIRLVRLVRMVRIVKLWKMHGGTEDVEEEFQAEPTKESDIEPTKVRKKLNEMTTRKLIIMILGTVMVLPYLDISGWATEVDDFYVVNELDNVWNMASSNMSLPEENLMLDNFVDGVDNLLYIKMCRMGVENSDTSCTENFPDPKYPSLSVIADKLRGSINPRADKNVVQYQEVIPEVSCQDPQDSSTCKGEKRGEGGAKRRYFVRSVSLLIYISIAFCSSLRRRKRLIAFSSQLWPSPTLTTLRNLF